MSSVIFSSIVKGLRLDRKRDWNSLKVQLLVSCAEMRKLIENPIKALRQYQDNADMPDIRSIGR